MNYVTGARLDAAGRARADEDGRSPGLWPADLHVVGKDIVRFHAIIWPAMLWAADLALPRSVFVHGFVQVGGAKMSKSGGGTVSPLEIAGLHGADALRYFLLREIAWGADGEFSLDRFKERTESDLANTVGNLLHRTLTMVEKYFDGVVPERSDNDYAPEGGEIHAVGALEVLVAARRDQAARAFDEQDFAWALEQTVDIARQANVRIDSVAPWRLMKAPGDEGRRVVADLLNVVVEGLKDVAVLLSPVLPGKSREMWRQLGLDEADLEALRIGIPGEGHKDVANLEELHPEKWFEAVDAVEVAGRRVRKGDPLFPRDDAKDPAGG
jgi:methionyl-tRNA synthetase